MALQNCALCLNEAPLCDSHIVPEFAYRPVYDETNSAVAVNVIKGHADVRQKGFSERLLCKSCESRFNRWETYFSRVWLHPKQAKRPKTLPDKSCVVSGLDYAQFKLFHMSVLWRMSVSRLEAFKPVRLRSRAEPLRQMLLDANPGDPRDFEFFGIALRAGPDNSWFDAMFHSPQRSRLNTQWIYTVLFGGTRWYYFASAHPGGRGVPTPTFSEDGVLTLGVTDASEDPFVRRDIELIQSIPKPALPKVRTRAI